jgi:hypothetical protein
MESKIYRGLAEAYSAVYNEDLRTELEDHNYQNLIDDAAIEIFENISLSLISQGYNSVDVLEYFANVDEEVIVEDIISISNGYIIFESVVDQRYIEEQLTQLDEILGAALRVGQAAVKAAKYAPKAASLGQRAMSALGGAGKAATRVAQQGTKASSVVRSSLGKAVQSVKGATGGVRSALGGAASKVKDVARGALNKLPGGSGGKLAKAGRFAGKAALGGAAFEAGSRGLSGLMGNKGTPSTQAKSKPSVDKSKYNASASLGGQTAFKAGGGSAALAAAQKKNPKATAADIQKRGTSALRSSAGGDLKKGAALFKAKQEIMSGKKPTSDKPAAPTPKPSTTTTTSTSYSKPKSTPTVKPSTTSTKPGDGKPYKDGPLWGPGSKPTDMGKKAESPTPSVKDKFPSTNSLGGSDIDKPKPAPTPVNKATGSKKPGSIVSGLDMFDLVKGHLLDEGYADTEEAAIAIMANMSEEWRESIVEGLTPLGVKTAGVVDDQRRGSTRDKDLKGTRDSLDRLKAYPKGFPGV